MSIKKLIIPVLATASLLLVPAAQASFNCSLNNATYYRGGYTPTSSGGLICQYDRYGGSYGDLKDSYNCSSILDTIKICGGDSAEGTCLVLKNSRGQCYVWNICDWNGTDQIDCKIDWRTFKCTEVEIFGCCKKTPPCEPPPTCVPEPTTVLAGVLLLVPLGVQTVRQLSRRQKPARI